MKKKIIILSLIFIFLLVYLYIFEIRLKEKRALNELENNKILKTKQIQTIQITNHFGKINLLKKNKNWIIKKINKKVDIGKITNILDDLSKSFIEEIKHSDLNSFGFKETNLSALINNDEALNFGFKTPIGPNRYTYNKKTKKIFIINNSLYSYLNIPLKAFRDKSIFSCNPDNINKIIYKNKNKTMVFIKKNKDWFLNNKTKTNENFAVFKDLICSLLASDFTNETSLPFTQIKISVFFANKKIDFKLRKARNKSFVEFNNEVFEISDYDYNTLTKAKNELVEQSKKD